MNYVKRTVAPTLRPVSLEDVKKHLKKTTSSEDDLITIYLDAAIAASENKLQTSIMNSRFTLYAKGFCVHLDLQKKWVSAVNSVKYYDADGNQQTVSASNYTLQDFKVPNVLCFNNSYSFPSTDDREFPVEIDFNAGFTAASGVIANIKDAVFLEATDRYENRQNELVGDRLAVVVFNSTSDKMLAEESLWL